jgi:hypothetical protein
MLEAEDAVTVSLYFSDDKIMGTDPYGWEGKFFSLMLEHIFQDCSTKYVNLLFKGIIKDAPL